MTFKKVFGLLVIVLLILSCSKEDKNRFVNLDMNRIKNVPKKKWDKLAVKRIYFGHQSVGYNIIDGFNLHLKGNQISNVKVKEGNSLRIFDPPVFAHSKIGENNNPVSKIDDFCLKMEMGLGERLDIAGFKFCYVDFNSETSINDTFEYYKKRMTEVSSKYPNLTLIHFTVPLRTIQSGPKAFIKKMIGKDIGVKDNMARFRFNQLLRDEFDDQLIFDIAKFESTYPNGQREFILINNEKIYNMIPSYSDDGSHLSENARYTIGGNFLLFLIDL